jgi:branched-chain amino acid transport system ATP-binding protein
MLEVANLHVAYNLVIQVIEGISFKALSDKVVALLGANGAGKSTTLKAVSGMLHSDNGAITAGQVMLDGENVTGQSASRMVKRGVVHVMEGRFVFPDLTVKENLLMGAYSLKDRSRLRTDIDHWLGFFPLLAARTNTQAGYLSGGEQQMLSIARALMAHPRLILLDEPSMGLSPLLVKEVFRVIGEIRQTHELTFLLVEQNVKMALKVADYGYVIERGLIRLEGVAEELRENEHLRDFYLGMGENDDESRADADS